MHIYLHVFTFFFLILVVYILGGNHGDVKILINDQGKRQSVHETSLVTPPLTSSLSENDVSNLAQFHTVSPYKSTSQNNLIAPENADYETHYHGGFQLPVNKLPPIDGVRRFNGFQQQRRSSMPVGKYTGVKINKAHVLPIMSASETSSVGT